MAGELVAGPGDAIHVSGPNGCGKTSLLRSLAGLDAHLPPAAVSLDGSDPRTWPAERLRSIAFVRQAALQGLAGLTVAGEHRLRGLASDDPRRVTELSTGEARLLALQLAFDCGPDLLLLDEPVEGLDESHVDWLREAMRGFPGTIVFTDHEDRLQVATACLAFAPAPSLDLAPIRGDGPTRSIGDRPAGPGLYALVGPNGSGKTTLLRRWAGLTDGPGIGTLGRDVRYLAPSARDTLWRDTVAEEVEAHPLVPEALRPRHPWSLSGGEMQRVTLAKVLGRPASIYLLDEPEAHLDVMGQRRLHATLQQRVDEGSIIVIASHDPVWIGLCQEPWQP